MLGMKACYGRRTAPCHRFLSAQFGFSTEEVDEADLDGPAGVSKLMDKRSSGMPQSRPRTEKSKKRIMARKAARRKGSAKSIGIPPKGSR
jgi:hypothetical protein